MYFYLYVLYKSACISSPIPVAATANDLNFLKSHAEYRIMKEGISRGLLCRGKGEKEKKGRRW
jgi:hypothetical protein